MWVIWKCFKDFGEVHRTVEGEFETRAEAQDALERDVDHERGCFYEIEEQLDELE